MFEKYEEGVDWRGPRNICKEYVLGEVLGWVQKNLSIVENIPIKKEPKVITNTEIPEEKVN